MRTSIDPTTLRELLRYDAGDGVLYWRERDSKFFQPTEKREASGHAKWWNGRFAGKRACKSDCNRGYLRVCLFGDEYPAHRVIWAMETGQWATNVIDHIDGDPANNRIANLRSATTAENNRNKANHGRSRFRGVSWRARQSIWVSAIKTNKKVTFLGCYKDEEDAARAYDVAAIEQHGNFARTNFPRADYEARIRSALVEMSAVKGEPEPVAWPTNLNPRTLDLVQRFALALAKKLRLAEEKYDHTDGWLRDDWESECRDHLYQHLEKGDPRDVAAYCAFMWHHGWSTIAPDDELNGCRAALHKATVKNAQNEAKISDLNDMVLRYMHRAETNESAIRAGEREKCATERIKK